MPFYDYKCERCGNRKEVFHNISEMSNQDKRQETKDKITCCNTLMTRFTDWSKGAPGIGKFKGMDTAGKRKWLKSRADENKNHQEYLRHRKKEIEQKQLGKK